MAITKESVSDVPAFDTRKYVRTLTRGGFSDQQANASTDGLQEALRGVAMKSDIGVLRAEMKSDIEVLRAEMKAEIGAIKMILEAQQEQMRRSDQMMVLGFTLLGVLFAVPPIVATFFG